MNCIFCCVFNQEKYVDMFFLLLESIFIYGNLDENTNILVYTSTPFMNIIKQSHLFNEKIIFEINDTYDNIDKACKARLDLFNLHSIINYSKILYLDTDILVKDNINKLFNVCKEDLLYVLEEGDLTMNDDFYGGKTLFGDEINNYNDKTAFTSGILLFNNCEKIKDLFNKINEDIVNRPNNFSCHDQPYIVYNAFKYNLYNNKILKSFVVNNDNNINSDKVIHHFPGGPGKYKHKIEAMTIFLKNIKLYTFNIPKILFQTNKTCHDAYVLDMITTRLTSDWKYEFYNDNDVIQFFIDNPITDLPDIIQKYNSFKKGAHRADLFRYYYLYVKGGFFMDSDAMLYVNIDTIVKEYNFISVNSSCYPGTIFQGILGASPKNKIIKKALYQAYNTDPNILESNYHYFCKQLYDIIKENDFGYNIKLYEERRMKRNNYDDILDKETVLFKHYWKNKVIPPMNTTQYTDEFTKIYNTNYWVKGSGSGSYIENTIIYNKYISEFIKNNKINSITDIGCGDWQSSYLIYQQFDNIDYIGLDCVNSVIENNKKNHPKYSFKTLDILCNIDLIRDSDLYIIKDVLQHWKLVDIYMFLDKLVTKKFKYIIITNNACQNNDDLELYNIGNGRGLHSNFLPLKKYNAQLLMEYFGDENKHMCIIRKDNLRCFDTKYGKIFLNKYDYYMVDVFSKNEYWDDKQLCILRDKYIPNDKNILEIGGHSGTSTIFYSKILKENNIIYTFEPQKQMFAILNKNIEINNLNSKIKTFNSAVFCKTGQINMHSEDMDGPSKGNIKILESENKNINYGGICLGKNGELTNCIKLDDLDFENIGYIHCDAQGAEPFIFSTATQFIKKHRPVILYEDMNLYGKYLFNIIKSSYPEFINNSEFDIKKYCIEELGYYCISNFNNSGFDSLLLPYLYTDWNNYNKSELNEFDYRILNTYKIPNNLVRVGPKEDGGYVIADGFEYDLFISCGIANDIRFEEAFLDIHKIKCVAFDGTIKTFPQHRNNMEWIPKNIGFSNTDKTTNLKEYIQTNKKIFLKMDIEGSEFNWLDSMTETELDNFSQIVLEVHWSFDIYRMNMLKKLNKTHYIIHIHGNNYGGTVTINNDKIPQIKLPEVFEVTYINKKLCDYSLVKIEEIQFPTILDYPNNPNADDIHFSIPIYLNLENKTYTWGENSYIKFLDNFKMDAFGEGYYSFINSKNIIANFGGREHNIIFNDDYTSFTSTRKRDLQIVNGKLHNI